LTSFFYEGDGYVISSLHVMKIIDISDKLCNEIRRC